MGQEGGGGYTNHYYTTQHTTYKGETHIETLIQGINLNDERTIAGKERKEGRWKMVKEEVNGKSFQNNRHWLELNPASQVGAQVH